MKGLIRKDLYMAWAYLKVFLGFILLFLIVGGISGENDFYLIYPMIIGMILPVSLVSYDERFKWNIACDALPCSRAQVVSAKYLLTLMAVGVIFLLTMLAQGLRLAASGDLSPLRQLAGVLIPLGLLGPALLLPVIFWLGVEKGRLLYFVLVGMVCALGVMLGSDMSERLAVLPDWLAIVGSLLLYAASWLLAVRLYEKRDF